ncbi:helix-turn-helix domain-containing protein [Bacterioplanoides sp.]|uniref:helix-turn-helix domain-containing protein n=1 Tax=Bacterioplanoides sp. TaxID=2066072 RepID=UPI003B5C8CBD
MTEEEVLRQIGLNVRRYRLQCDMSQEALAERAGIHPTYISGIEKGRRNASVLKLNSIATVLGVELAGLFSFQ